MQSSCHISCVLLFLLQIWNVICQTFSGFAHEPLCSGGALGSPPQTPSPYNNICGLASVMRLLGAYNLSTQNASAFRFYLPQFFHYWGTTTPIKIFMVQKYARYLLLHAPISALFEDAQKRNSSSKTCSPVGGEYPSHPRAHCNVGPRHHSVYLRMQTYTEPVPWKDGKVDRHKISVDIRIFLQCSVILFGYTYEPMNYETKPIHS